MLTNVNCSAYGCLHSPSLKLGTNTALWLKQENDIGINGGGIVNGDGQNKFVPWQLGAVMQAAVKRAAACQDALM